MFKMRPTLLFIDDDAFFRELYSKYFEAMGFCVLTAPNGAKGLRMLARERPDALVTDWEMPGMNGLEVVEAAKRTAPGVPVVVCSAHDCKDSLARSVRNGAWAFVPKRSPYLSDLKGVLERCMRRARKNSRIAAPKNTPHMAA